MNELKNESTTKYNHGICCTFILEKQQPSTSKLILRTILWVKRGSVLELSIRHICKIHDIIFYAVLWTLYYIHVCHGVIISTITFLCSLFFFFFWDIMLLLFISDKNEWTMNNVADSIFKGLFNVLLGKKHNLSNNDFYRPINNKYVIIELHSKMSCPYSIKFRLKSFFKKKYKETF